MLCGFHDLMQKLLAPIARAKNIGSQKSMDVPFQAEASLAIPGSLPAACITLIWALQVMSICPSGNLVFYQLLSDGDVDLVDLWGTVRTVILTSTGIPSSGYCKACCPGPTLGLHPRASLSSRVRPTHYRQNPRPSPRQCH